MDNIYYLIIGAIIGIVIYYINPNLKIQLPQTVKKKTKEEIELIKEIKTLNEAQLYLTDIEKLRKSAGLIAEEREQGKKLAITSTYPYVHVNHRDWCFKMAMASSRNKMIDKSEHKINSEKFDRYYSNIKGLELELRAESISEKEFNDMKESEKSKLFKGTWNIQTTDSGIAKDLLDLGMITEKQYQVVVERENKEEEEQKQKEEEDELKQKKDEKSFYVNYILKGL